MTPTLNDIYTAAERIKGYVKRTPVFTSTTLNSITNANLFFKCENFQKTGAFKFRGACNAVFALSENDAKKGVATHSSGNHGGALALAAKTRGIPAYIVMPDNSPRVKIEAVASYGAEIIFCKPTMKARQDTLESIIAKTGANFIHPYDNIDVISGQGTTALEFFEQVDDLEMLVVPVGGGGLISGISLVAKSLSQKTAIIGAEPETANDAYLSFRKKEYVEIKNPKTICDGLLTNIGKLTLPIILQNVNDILTVKEETVLKATQYIWERMKIVVEPSGAASFAAILEHPQYFSNKKVGVLLSGGNVDIKIIANQFLNVS